MPVKLNSTGGGSVTVDVGSTASNFTQNLPLATTTLVGTDTTQTLTNKTLTSPTITGNISDGTNSTSATNCIQGSAKAWVDFNGSGGSIRASYNVSSITVNGTGNYTVNFTNAFSDANYCAVTGASSSVSNRAVACSTNSLSTTTITLWTADTGNAVQNPTYVNVAILK